MELSNLPARFFHYVRPRTVSQNSQNSLVSQKQFSFYFSEQDTFSKLSCSLSLFTECFLILN